MTRARRLHFRAMEAKKTAEKLEAKIVLDSMKVVGKNVQGGGKTECKNDVDCPSSYCMNGWEDPTLPLP